jgi:hypothetical protein
MCVQAQCASPSDVSTMLDGSAGAFADATLGADSDLSREDELFRIPTRAVHAISVPVSAHAIVADPARRRIYATCTNSAPQYANQLVTIDADTAQVVHTLPVGLEPTTLAISDDGSTLWVSIWGAHAIREVDLTGPEPKAEKQVVLPTVDFGVPLAAGPMVVLPGTTKSLVVSLLRLLGERRFSGIVVLDDGVPRPASTPVDTGASSLTLGPAPHLYGFNNDDPAFPFYVLTVSAEGLSQTTHLDLAKGSAVDVAYGDGYVYATGGQVIDVRTATAPRAAGNLPIGGAMYPLPNGEALVLSTGLPRSAVAIRRISVATSTVIESAVVLDDGNAIFAARSIVRVAPGVIAFLSSSDLVTSAPSGGVFIVKDETLVP